MGAVAPPPAGSIGTPFTVPIRSSGRSGLLRGEVYGLRSGDPASPTKLLLLHGVGLTLSTWLDVVPALAQHADVAAIDLLGHGRSRAGNLRSVTMRAQVMLPPLVLDALGWGRAILVGHSMGGGIALGTAGICPHRVAGLVLLGSVAYPQPLPACFRPFYLPGAAQVLAAVGQVGTRYGGADYLHRSYGYHPLAAVDYLASYAKPDVARAIVTAIRDLRPSIYADHGRWFPWLRQPTLILHGERDNIVPVDVPRRLHAALPDAELQWLARRHHIAQETAGAEVAGRIVDFLARRFPEGTVRGRPAVVQ